jgi:uncharacterized protein
VRVEPFAILSKHYDPSGKLFGLLVTHSLLVARKARQLARAYNKRHPDKTVDMEFLTEASLLHDIGIQECDAPAIFCTGTAPYICHGVLGRQILEAEGLPRHALVCERHTGAGITRADVESQKLPLPDRSFLPVSIEEKLICVADKFYSKIPERLWKEKKLRKIEKTLSRFGPEAPARWMALCRECLPDSDAEADELS